MNVAHDRISNTVIIVIIIDANVCSTTENIDLQSRIIDSIYSCVRGSLLQTRCRWFIKHIVISSLELCDSGLIQWNTWIWTQSRLATCTYGVCVCVCECGATRKPALIGHLTRVRYLHSTVIPHLTALLYANICEIIIAIIIENYTLWGLFIRVVIACFNLYLLTSVLSIKHSLCTLASHRKNVTFISEPLLGY